MKEEAKENILVSACLLGLTCRYDGASRPNEAVLKLFSECHMIPVCPEQLGGLPTPRPASEVVRDGAEGKVIVLNCEGCDVTAQYQKGASETLKIAQLYHCQKAVLKAKSPSCGKGRIYDGTFSRTLRSGNGITAQLLADHGISICTEEEL